MRAFLTAVFAALMLWAPAAAQPLLLSKAGNNSLIPAPFASVNGTTDVYTCAATANLTPNGCFNGWSVQYAAQPTISADVPFSVTRQGYTTAAATTTYVDTFYVVKTSSPGGAVRQPYSAGGNQNLQSPLTAAVNDYVYSTDTVAGGITNNSTITSPKPLCQWESMARSQVTTTITAEIICAHRNARLGSEVAAVQCNATDSAAATSTGPVVSSMTVSTSTTDKAGKVLVYLCTVDVSGLANGTIKLNAKAYPWIGAAASVADSSTSSEARGFSPRYYQKVASLAPYYVYVKPSGSGGNDATCVASQTEATAALSPCATLGNTTNGALVKLNATAGKVDGGIIKIDLDGSYALGTPTSALTQNNACVTITRSTNATAAGAIVTFGNGAPAARPKLSTSLDTANGVTEGCLRFNDISVTRNGTGTITGEAAAQLQIQFDNISTLDNGSNNATWLANSHDYFNGAAITNLTGTSALGAGTYEHRWLRGVSLTATAATTIEAYHVVSSRVRSVTLLLGSGARSFSGGLHAFNYLSDDCTSPCSTVAQQLSQTADVDGFAMLQNVFEYSAGGTVTTYTRISGDSATANNNNIIGHLNTYSGAWQAGRCNCFYDEGATARMSRLQSFIGDLQTAWYIKGDVFVTTANRIGNWGPMYGVGFRSFFSQYQSNDPVGGTQAPAYGGYGSSIGTLQTTPQMATSYWTTFAGTTCTAGSCNGSNYNSGAGNGVYSLTANSPVKQFVTDTPLPYDYAGTSRCGGSTCTAATKTAAGAYESP